MRDLLLECTIDEGLDEVHCDMQQSFSCSSLRKSLAGLDAGKCEVRGWTAVKLLQEWDREAERHVLTCVKHERVQDRE